MKIGLLGGSFNPAHAGHLHLSTEAIKRLGLDEVWWILSPQNPLKSRAEIADYALRRRKACEVAAANPQIHLCEIEAEQHLSYTVDTLHALKANYPQHHFLWLMGADNLLQLHQWKNWQEIFALVPIAVFDRDVAGGGDALASVAALHYADARMEQGFEQLAEASLPRWAYISMPKHPASATQLRNMLGMDAFLMHNERS